MLSSSGEAASTERDCSQFSPHTEVLCSESSDASGCKMCEPPRQEPGESSVDHTHQ